MLFLPECFSLMATSSSMTIAESERVPGGETVRQISEMARDNKIWISGGSIHERADEVEEGKVWNTGFVVDDKGEFRGKYRKAHLFTIETPAVTLGETLTTLPGSSLTCISGTPVGTLGLAICYDLRFPYLSSSLRRLGSADVIIYPSAFTVPTGLDHWSVLLRSRAVENQCYVVAAAQAGRHGGGGEGGRTSYGHSMCVEPGGRVVAEGGG
ncbi:hypothetical protein TrRE_jg8164, partial [Triparma retinervis]